MRNVNVDPQLVVHKHLPRLLQDFWVSNLTFKLRLNNLTYRNLTKIPLQLLKQISLRDYKFITVNFICKIFNQWTWIHLLRHWLMIDKTNSDTDKLPSSPPVFHSITLVLVRVCQLPNPTFPSIIDGYWWSPERIRFKVPIMVIQRCRPGPRR